MRQLWIDDLRTKVVCLVLFFHVFWYYASCTHSSNYGGFTDTQYIDSIVYLLYPWMMMLLFIVSGISSRKALQKYSPKEFRHSRTLKLLVPGTIGLFVFQWIAGYFNMLTVGAANGTGDAMLEGVPVVIRYIIHSIIGGGHLWFIQLLWLFALITPWLPQNNRKPSHLPVYLVLGFLLIYAAEQTVLDLPLQLCVINTFRPVVYFTCYLLGFYLFYEDSFLDLLDCVRYPLYALAILGGILLTVLTFGEDPNGPAYLRSWYNNLYAWFAILAMIAFFRRNRNTPQTNRVLAWAEAYTNKCSYGLYILHYVFIAGVGYSLRAYTALPAWACYTILFICVFALTPLTYELISRIPVVRWCVLGMKPKK